MKRGYPLEQRTDRIRHLDLHSTHYGTGGPPLVILHGLLGSSRNWRSVAQTLAKDYSVITVDIRNHGQSPHAKEMDYTHMVADVRGLLRKHQLRTVHLLGHSLGGKIAMALALTDPRLLKSLIVVDIAPVAYGDRYSAILQSLQALRIDAATSRTAIDRALGASIPEAGLRQFLLMNLASTPQGYRWNTNLDALQHALPDLLAFPEPHPGTRFSKPALFLAGERSDYIRPQHHSLIRHLFPASRFVVIDRAGHWPHVENPNDFITHLAAFLRSVEEPPGITPAVNQAQHSR